MAEILTAASLVVSLASLGVWVFILILLSRLHHHTLLDNNNRVYVVISLKDGSKLKGYVRLHDLKSLPSLFTLPVWLSNGLMRTVPRDSIADILSK